ncbi:MAG: DNA internalization-related competence protein ComEC/Rec2, partial [Pseudomonadales bacterium]
VVHQQGFWLSFTAVAALLGYFVPMHQADSGWGAGLLAFVKTQWVLLIALSPLLALTQGAIPLLGPVANLVVVPFLMFLVLPLVMLVGLCFWWAPEAAQWLLQVADQGLEWLMWVVRYAASFSPVSVASRGMPGSILLALGVCALLLAVGTGWRLGVGVLWLGLLIPQDQSPRFGEFHVSALDVGQGSAILIDTRWHRLIFDVGPAYPSGFDLGEVVVVPSYLSRGWRLLNGLILSHDDSDHSGGASAVVDALNPQHLWASFQTGAIRNTAGVVRSSCRRGDSWKWDGVRFSFLHPSSELPGNDNDRSCVLLVEAGTVRALIAGDISRQVERKLAVPAVQLLFAPHHGSKTSSSSAFIRAAQPKLVFISTSRRSRYGHPHPEVLRRYEALGARIFTTGKDGALGWVSSRPDEVRRSRTDGGAYWHRKSQAAL